MHPVIIPDTMSSREEIYNKWIMIKNDMDKVFYDGFFEFISPGLYEFYAYDDKKLDDLSTEIERAGADKIDPDEIIALILYIRAMYSSRKFRKNTNFCNIEYCKIF